MLVTFHAEVFPVWVFLEMCDSDFGLRTTLGGAG